MLSTMAMAAYIATCTSLARPVVALSLWTALDPGELMDPVLHLVQVMYVADAT